MNGWMDGWMDESWRVWKYIAWVWGRGGMKRK